MDSAVDILRRKLREQKQAVEATERELELLLKPRDKAARGHGASTGTLFYLRVITDDVPEVVNPRDTIGAHLCGRKWSDFCFWALYKNKSVALLISLFSSICPVFLWVLSITVDPTFGWATLLGLPFILILFSVYNLGLLYRVATSFEWWAVLILLGIIVGTMIDAFAADPPRTVGACCFFLGVIVATLGDARPLFKNASVLVRVFYILWACVFWTALILWWLNKWILVRETVIPLGNVITLNVQSIGFSCFSSVAVLFTRYAWISLRDKTGGTMVMIKARVQYLPLNVSPSKSMVENRAIVSVTQTDEAHV